MNLADLKDGARHCIDKYLDNAPVRSIGAAGALYGGLSAVKAFDASLGELADMAAPIAGGLVLNHKINDDEVCRSDTVRNVLQIALAGAVGWDLAGTISGYSGNADAITYVQDMYQQFHSTVADNLTDVHDPAKTGGLLGGLGVGGYKFYKNSKDW